MNSDSTSSEVEFTELLPGAVKGFEKLALGFPVPGDGTVYIYFANESNDAGTNVYVDDITVIHEKTTSSLNVAQVNDYYPFGMVMAGTAYNDELTRHPQLYKFNGNEVLEGEGIPTGLNLMNFSARLYNPALGVFLAVDPQNQFANPYLAFGNNPTNYIDPDGEFAWFIPLIIGAVINTALNAKNINSVWDALGYAAVGAASGALGAGLGTGISAALGGAPTFGAGFAAAFSGTGTLAGAGITGVSSSFFTGAAIGAGTGAGAGFIGGLGNGLVGGENFNDAFGMGINYGLIGGVIGGIIGGFAGGINAAKDGRYFWTGEPQTLDYSYNLEGASQQAIQQVGDKDCMIGCTKYISDSNGKNLTEQQIKELLGDAYDPAVGTDMTKGLNNAGINHVSGSKIGNPSDIGVQMDLGNPTIIAQSRNHAVVPVRIDRWIRGVGDRARFYYKAIVMDPATGRFVNRGNSIFNNPFFTLFWR